MLTLTISLYNICINESETIFGNGKERKPFEYEMRKCIPYSCATFEELFLWYLHDMILLRHT